VYVVHPRATGNVRIRCVTGFSHDADRGSAHLGPWCPRCVDTCPGICAVDFACLADAGLWVTLGKNTKTDAAIRGEILGPDPTGKMVCDLRLDIHFCAGHFQIWIV